MVGCSYSSFLGLEGRKEEAEVAMRIMGKGFPDGHCCKLALGSLAHWIFKVISSVGLFHEFLGDPTISVASHLCFPGHMNVLCSNSSFISPQAISSFSTEAFGIIWRWSYEDKSTGHMRTHQVIPEQPFLTTLKEPMRNTPAFFA